MECEGLVNVSMYAFAFYRGILINCGTTELFLFKNMFLFILNCCVGT